MASQHRKSDRGDEGPLPPQETASPRLCATRRVTLIQRFYDVAKGKILLDGRPISDYDVRHLRRHIGVVAQDNILYRNTGGGAFVNPETRKNVHRDGVSVWLKADLDILVQRVSRRNDRPLLKNDNPRATLERLIEQRYPCYAEADITVDTGNEPPDSTVGKVVDALNAHAAALTKETAAR